MTPQSRFGNSMSVKRGAYGEAEAILMMEEAFAEQGKVLSVKWEDGMWRGHGVDHADFHLFILHAMEKEGVKGFFKFFCFGKVGNRGRLSYIYTPHPDFVK